MDHSGGQVTTTIDEFGDYAALDPFFRIIEEGLAGSRSWIPATC